MKRHPSLAILSREHHGALILAQLLKKGAPVYKGLPTDVAGKIIYALHFYKEELIKHFNLEEEQVLKKVKGISKELDTLTAEIAAEHQLLHSLFASIKIGGDETETTLDKLGRLLEQHIRKEERILFPLIQEQCNETMLLEIEKSLLS